MNRPPSDPLRDKAPAALALIVALALAAPPLITPASAEERTLTLKDQTGVDVAIYNGNFALVKDRRTVKLTKGTNVLAFIDVSARIRPETALLRGLKGMTLTLIEQNFDFDLLTPKKLLEKSVGQTVAIIKTHPTTGVETFIKAKVLSAANGVVLQIGERIETGIPGRLVFDKVPPNLRPRPTLVVTLDSPRAVTGQVELSYLTRSLGWRADYVAEINAKEDRLDLNGWVTLTNRSGTTYRNARLQLVAGDVHRARRRGRFAGAEAAAMRKTRPPPRMRQEGLFDYHLYTLGRPTTIADNQTKQVALMNAAGVAVAKSYRLDGSTYFYRSRYTGPRKRKIGVWLEFKNSEKSGLGLPLPKGVVRVYKRDSAGRAIFIGEDRIDHTPRDETIRLKMGHAFDVTAERVQTAFTRHGLAKNTYESAYKITLKNARKGAVTVVVAEPIPGDWTLLGENAKHKKISANRVEWRIKVPARGKAELTYRVRVRY